MSSWTRAQTLTAIRFWSPRSAAAQTLAFEPDPDAAQPLGRDIEGNGTLELATLFQFALGSRTGEAPFPGAFDPMTGVSHLADSAVRVVLLGRLGVVTAASTEPLLVKLDVEGHEEAVISGASKTLQSPKLLAIKAELQSLAIDRPLSKAGFLGAFYEAIKRRFSRQPLSSRSAHGPCRCVI
jgi:FkbM family methyltransferase